MKTVELIDDILNDIDNSTYKTINELKKIIVKLNKNKTLKELRMKELSEEVEDLNKEIYILKEKKNSLMERINIQDLLSTFN